MEFNRLIEAYNLSSCGIDENAFSEYNVTRVFSSNNSIFGAGNCCNSQEIHSPQKYTIYSANSEQYHATNGSAAPITIPEYLHNIFRLFFL